MSTPSPYNLTPNSRSSDGYYRAVGKLADRWLESARAELSRPVSDHLAWRAQSEDTNSSAPISFDEAAFEMLVLGVLLRERGTEALNMAPIPAWLLARLVEAQDRLPHPAVEKPVKAVRGLIHGLSQTGEIPDCPVDELPFSGEAEDLVARLSSWLSACGLTAQAAHIAIWRDYLDRLPEQSAQAILARCLLLADDFAIEGQAGLGEFTTGVNDFIEHVKEGPDTPWVRGCRSRWRYDAALVTRTPIEYHLAMLGSEILSRAYRARFEAAPRKIVIMPDCLCARSRRVETSSGLQCQAELTSLGYRCAGCTPACRVYQITRLGEKHGFEAYILPDDLRGIGLGSCSRLSGVGVVGVSCALTNFDAGWLVNDAGVPAQGLLLNFAGCRSHWTEDGQTTEINLARLLEII